jgi:hypothetical protein
MGACVCVCTLADPVYMLPPPALVCACVCVCMSPCSPTRAGVFFVSRMDGVVDVWDYYYRQNEASYKIPQKYNVYTYVLLLYIRSVCAVYFNLPRHSRIL